MSRKMALLYYKRRLSNAKLDSSWLVLVYTFERFISVRFPLKRAIICSVRRMRFAILPAYSCVHSYFSNVRFNFIQKEV